MRICCARDWRCILARAINSLMPKSGRARQRRLPGSRLRLGVRLRRRKQSQLELFNINFGPLTVALVVVLAEILISLTLCSSKCSPHSPAHAALLFCCLLILVVLWSASRKCPKNRVKPENTRGFSGIFGVLPVRWTLECGQWRSSWGSLPLSVIGLPYIVVQPA